MKSPPPLSRVFLWHLMEHHRMARMPPKCEDVLFSRALHALLGKNYIWRDACVSTQNWKEDQRQGYISHCLISPTAGADVANGSEVCSSRESPNAAANLCLSLHYVPPNCNKGLSISCSIRTFYHQLIVCFPSRQVLLISSTSSSQTPMLYFSFLMQNIR